MNCFNPDMTELNCPLTFKWRNVKEKWRQLSQTQRQRGRGRGWRSGLRAEEGWGSWRSLGLQETRQSCSEVWRSHHAAPRYRPNSTGISSLHCSLHRTGLHSAFAEQNSSIILPAQQRKNSCFTTMKWNGSRSSRCKHPDYKPFPG